MKKIPDASTLSTWRKSSHSDNGDGGCIEISDSHPDGIPVRDSKNPNGPAVIFVTTTWRSFVDSVKGRDLPA
ncbi:hypothetical protein GCM10023084_20710 [Streptomyces lacrimifluminis]|uniref:DUF397 domain-containing protein n=1 Tax=Streptomyces lacrimifluminis TaxID=1500077 RepID=A0A917NWD6_9ACTN|nr:DUF397 domain-containing protein [Streptomyces lacrimifluminis]GGJ35202.1 hypothetical protein GCM10012282_34920 [Streptomyces lacrimifluminis]